VLEGKAVLEVDDEPDVLEAIAEVHDLRRVDTAGAFDRAEQMLQTGKYEVVIPDVLGVKGWRLLDPAVERKSLAVMLTAPALSPDYILRAMERGAISYVPKEDPAYLDPMLAELFDSVTRGDSPWRHTLNRLEPFLDEPFHPDWRQEHSALWDDLDKRSPKSI
jgi:DNA-binding response OmpR family regulator